MKVYSIYSIRNKINGKRYIGLSYKPIKRMESHRKNPFPIGRAIRKYGWNNFDKRILKTGLTLKQAQKAEQFYIAKYNSLSPNGYNLCSGGEGVFNFKFSEKSKKKMSKSQKGNTNNLGNKHTKEAIEKCRKASLGNKYAKGNKHSKKLKIKWSKERKGQNNPAWTPHETRICACGCGQTFNVRIKFKKKYINAKHYGKAKSKIMLGNQNTKGFKHNKETKKKMSKHRQGKNNPNYKHGKYVNN